MNNRILYLLIMSLVCSSLSQAAERTVYPWKDGLTPDRKIDQTQGADISWNNGELKIVSPQNGYAHVQYPLESAETLRATVEIKTDGSHSWAPGLCLYWDEENYFKIHFAGNDGGVFGTELVNGVLKETNFSISKGNEYNSVPMSEIYYYDENLNWSMYKMKIPSGADWMEYGIELTQDSVYYLSTQDEKGLRMERVLTRTGVLKNPPKLLIVGKGYTNKATGFIQGDLNNDYSQDIGSITESYARNLKIDYDITTSLAQESVLAYRNLGVDVDGLKIFAQGEPTFDRVAALYPAPKYTREALGVKEHRVIFLNSPEGSLQHPRLTYFTLGEQKQRIGLEPNFPKKHLEEGYLPIVVHEYDEGDLQLRQTTFGHSQGMSPDTPALAYIQLEVANRSQQPKNIQLGYAQMRGEELLHWENTLEPNTTQSIYLELPWSTTDQVHEVDAEVYNRCHRETKEYWEKLLNSGMKIVTPEKRINDAYRAWLSINFMNTDKIGEQYMIHDGSNFYDELYGYSAALAIEAFDWMGFGNETAKYIESFVPEISQEGLLLTNYGLPDHGAFLIAFANHCEMTGDTDLALKMAPIVTKMARWIVDTRNRQKPHQDETGPVYGLIKEKPYCDYLDRKAYYYVSDMTLTVGLEMVARVFQKIGLTSEAQWINDEAVDYRRCIMNSMEKSVINHDGFEFLPMFPETHELLLASNYGASDYYGLTLGTLLEIDALPTDSRFAEIYVNALEKRGGITLGACQFNEGIDHAYTYGYWMYCLGKDEIDKVLLGLYTSLAYGMCQSTYSSFEVSYHRTGNSLLTQPHTYSNTQQLRLLRNILLREEGSKLLLGQAIPRAWLEDGKEISIADAPTRFGNVNYSIQSQIGSGKITATVVPPSKFPAESIVLRLRHPAEKPIQQVNLQGQGTAQIEGDRIILTNLNGPITLEACYH